MEAMVVVAILGLMVSMISVDVAKMIGRAKTQATLGGLTQSLNLARLQAIKRHQPVVVEVSLEQPGNRINLRAFEDRSGDFTLGNYTPATGPAKPEEILNDFSVVSGFRLQKKGGAADDLDGAVIFDGYNGDANLKNRIAFLPDGSIAPPSAADCTTPTAAGGRGLYLADIAGASFYRISFATNLVARPRIDKWLPQSSGYADTGWSW